MKKSVLVLGITALGLAILGIGALIFDIFVHAPGIGSLFNFIDPLPVILGFFVWQFPNLLFLLPVVIGITFFVLLIIRAVKKKHKAKILTAINTLVVTILLTPIAARVFVQDSMFSPLPVHIMVYIQPIVIFQLISNVFAVVALTLVIISSSICLAYVPVDRRKVLEQQLSKGQVHKEDPIVIPPTITPDEDDEPEAREEKPVEETPVVNKEETPVNDPMVPPPAQEPVKVEVKIEPTPQQKEEVVTPKVKKVATKKAPTKKASPTTKVKTTEATPKPTEVKAKTETKAKTVAKKTTVKPEVKPAIVEVKEAKEVKTPTKVEAKRVYHLNKREQDNKWTIIFTGGKKVLKLCNTQKEAIEYVQALCATNGGTYLVHNSKGANKGRIKKKA